MSGRAPQLRSVCFTVPTRGQNDDLPLLDPYHPTWKHFKALVYSYEIAPTTGQLHIQGYLELTQPVTFEALHRWEGLEWGHFEKRRGTAKQARHYCMKPVPNCDCVHCVAERKDPTHIDGPYEFGEFSAQGQRADLLQIKRDIDNGRSLKRIAADEDTFPTWIKHIKGFETYKRITTEPRRHKPLVVLFVGPSNTGKTRTAMCLGSYIGRVYKVPPKSTGFWCDDYANEDVFIIDEMNGHKMSPEFFNELVDWSPMNVPSHGSAGHQFTSPYVFITSNYHPKYWWKKRSVDQVKQTMRRIDIIIKMLNPIERWVHSDFQVFRPQ